MLKKLLKKTPKAKREALLEEMWSVAPRDPDHLHDWMHIYCGLWIPREKVCPDHDAPFDAFCASYFAEAPVVLWEGARGFAGKSITLSGLGYCEAVTLGANLRILGGSGEQAQRINAYLRNEDPNSRDRFWEAQYAPKHLLKGDTKTELSLKNGGYIKALMASSTSIRGAHPQRLRIDEADEMDLVLFDAAMGQTMSSEKVKAQTTISSTHHHPDGTMTELKDRAQKRGWKHFRWCWRETLQPHGWLDPAEVERKRAEVTDQMFANEYDLQEPNPEGRMFTPEQLDIIFFGEVLDAQPPFERHFIEADGSAMYTGTDWGKAKDFTVIHTMKEVEGGPDELAAWGKFNKMSWPEMVGLHNERVSRFGGASAHDATGVGGVVDDYLVVDSEPFNFSWHNHRRELLNEYVGAGQNGAYRYPKIRSLYEAHKYLTHDHLFGRKHLPDEIAAAALAWWAKENQTSEIFIGRAV